MKVLAVSSYGVLGGAELSMAEFIAHRPEGWEAEAFLVSDGALRGRLEELGVPVAAAEGCEGRPDPLKAARFARTFGPALKLARPDVVWATGTKAALLALPSCLRRRVPLVWHKVDLSWDASLAKPVGALVTGVVSVSDAAAAALGPLAKRKLIGVVGPPVRLPESLASAPDPANPLIGTLGRLVPYKGHHHILRAAAELGGEFPSLRVLLAGEAVSEYPGYPDELRALAQELGIAERVEMPGFVANVAAVLERMSVFVNATYRDEEGFGFEALSGAMLEASWVGVPVVATAGGGTAEGMQDGATGTLVPEAAPGPLAAAIRPYLADPALAARTGAAGRKWARREFAPGPASAKLFGYLGSATE